MILGQSIVDGLLTSYVLALQLVLWAAPRETRSTVPLRIAREVIEQRKKRIVQQQILKSKPVRG